MEKSIKFSFGKEPTEGDILSKYKAAREVFEQYSKDRLEEVKDEQTANIYEENCMRKIGNFAHGFEHKMTAGEYTLFARLEAHKNRDNTYGELRMLINGTDELVAMVEKAWSCTEVVSMEKILPMIRPYFDGKRYCYGHCKE